MRTQLDDLKEELKNIEHNINYCKWKGIEGSEMHKYLINKRHEVNSKILNIQ